MYFNVSQLLKEPIGSIRSYEMEDRLSLGIGGVEYTFAGLVKMLRTDKGIWISASLDSKMHCSCSRCLEDLRYPIEIGIEEEYLPEFDILTGARLNDPEDTEENFLISSEHIIDMTEAVRQYLDINTPMSPICDENCRGMCLTCGVNLNETSCSCNEAPTDPRWGALMGLVSVKEQELN